MIRFLFLVLLATLPLEISAAWAAPSDADLTALAQSKQWLRLLHFKHAFPFGTLRSEVDSVDFFFSPRGNHDPLAELQASIAAFQNPNPKPTGPLGLTPQCAFPARYHFLKSQLHWESPEPVCPELEDFLKKVDADEISLVFSSAYPNSPPSMFGHTLLRLHRHDRAELMDYAVNYAAATREDENAIAFAVLGLMGGYFGQFGIVPYYMKVNEYNHAESRDLWEYDLTLSKEEVRVFLWHLWEVKLSAAFRYYFFDENCSFRILTLLEVAKPEWDLSQFAIEVIPAETVKRVVNTPGAVRAIHYRPSLHAQMKKRFEQLDSGQRDQAFKLIHGEIDPSSVSDIPALEAAIAYFQFRRLKGSLHLESEDLKRFNSTLIRRASLARTQPAEPASKEPTTEIPQEGRPDLGHAPYLVGLGAGALSGFQASSPFGEFRFKFAYHDLLNSDVGYIPFSEVNFPNITLRYRLDSLWIERLGLVTITSLFPVTELEKQVSWKLDLSYISPKDLNCVDCHAVMQEGGAGGAIGFFSNRLVVYSLGLLHFEEGSSVNTFRFTPKILAATLIHPVENLKIQLSGSAVADVWQSVRQSHFYEFEWNNSLSLSQNWEVRAAAKMVLPGDRQENVTYREFSFDLNRYF